jgi:hypothetical protein
MLAQLHLIIASKFIKSFNLSPNDFLFSINSGPKNVMIASPCVYEIKPLQVMIRILKFTLKSLLPIKQLLPKESMMYL